MMRTKLHACGIYRAVGAPGATQRHQRLARAGLPHGTFKHHSIQIFGAQERSKVEYVEPIHGCYGQLEQHAEQRFGERERQQH